MQIKKNTWYYNLQGTKNLGIKYMVEEENTLSGYTDSDWAGLIDDRKNPSGYIFYLGTKAISWSSKKQKTVALSFAEAEYIAATDAACEAVWLRIILSDLKVTQKFPTQINGDNISPIAMTKNLVFYGRTKYIELRHHFIKNLVNNGEIELNFVNTNDQQADLFTKAISTEKLVRYFVLAIYCDSDKRLKSWKINLICKNPLIRFLYLFPKNLYRVNYLVHIF